MDESHDSNTDEVMTDEDTIHRDRTQDDGAYGDGTDDSAAPDGAQLGERLSYLFVLLKRGDALLRRGSRTAPGVLQGQGRVLRLLLLHSPVAQKDLAFLLGIRSQSLGELLGKLEISGLIARHPDPQDRRTWLVEITEEGRRAAKAQPTVEEGPFGVLDDAERTQLANLLDRVIEGIEDSLPGAMNQRLHMMREAWSGQQDRSSHQGGAGWQGMRRARDGGEWAGWFGQPTNRGRNGDRRQGRHDEDHPHRNNRGDHR